MNSKKKKKEWLLWGKNAFYINTTVNKIEKDMLLFYFNKNEKPQAAQAHYVWVRASEVIWSEYTRIIGVLSDAKWMQKS